MKTLPGIALTAVFTVALGLSAHAGERTDEPGETVTASIAQAPSGAAGMQSQTPAIDEKTVAALVYEALGAPGGETEDGAALIEQSLRAFYAGSSAAPIWVSGGAPNAKARDAAAEIARAAAFGLDPQDYAVPDIGSVGGTPVALAEFELAMTRAVLAYAGHAKAGRIAPEKAGHSLNVPEGLKDPRSFLEALQSGGGAAGVLRDLHPRHPQFAALTKKLAELRGTDDKGPRVRIPDGPVLRAGVTHEHIALLRKRLDIPGADGPGAEKYDEAVEKAVIAFQKRTGLKADGVVGNGTRARLNGSGSNEQQIVRVLVNMERWRWLPDDMGGKAGLYAWVNIPEFRVRLVKGGEVVFSERAIVGKPGKQTPVFSDQMEWIEIHPTWYVPNSIKVEDIKPSLRRPTSTVMERYNLKLDCGRHGRDWRKIDWSKVDIRNCSVSQPPGEKSVLGDFKFKFPNKHIVYMHDTPSKRLFDSATRTYSHGCVRVQNPRRMAEILLDNDKGMPASRIGEILKGPRRLHKEDLNRFVPVHMTYFTAFFGGDGSFQTRPDYYGHDRRLAQALTGKGHLMPAGPVAVSKRRHRGPRTRTARDTAWRNAFISAN